jgi:beta-carotene hydroxylase
MARAVDMTIATNRSLRMQEKDIADQFIGGFPFLIVAWGIINTAIWFSLWPLVFFGIIPLWIAFIIACVNITASYLPAHDAQHYIIARKGSRFEWFNEAFGHIVLVPLTLPFRTARITHMEHHKHTNDPLRDPDYSNRASGPIAAILKTIQNRQPRAIGGANRYVQMLKQANTKAAKTALIDALIMKIFHFGVLTALAWNGYAIEALLLWWLPKHIALTYIYFYLSWAPHHPSVETGRYRDTRGFKSRLGNLLSMGMQYHIVHHLYPNIPLNKTPAAYRALRPILLERGCDMGTLQH